MDIDQKLGMSLDDISGSNKRSSGPVRNSRANRVKRQSSPYKKDARGSGFSGKCNTCGGMGHMAKQCPSAPGVLKSSNGNLRGQGQGAVAVGKTVYVGNLSWEVQWQDLKDHMRQAGEVTRADVMTEGGVDGGRSKGCGIVEYRTVKDARRAINQLNDTDLKGRMIFVREDREPKNGAPAPRAAGRAAAPARNGNAPSSGGFRGLCLNCKGFGHLAKDCNAATVCNNCGRDGHLVSQCTNATVCNNCKRPGHLARDCNAPTVCVTCGKSGHFSYECRGNTVSNGNNNLRNGGSGNQLYVGNLSWDTTWQDLKDAFRGAGNIEYADIMTGPDGRSKGFGTVRFSTAAEARRAINDLNGAQFDGRVIEVRLDNKA